MSTENLLASMAQLTGGPAKDVIELSRFDATHLDHDPVCMLFDTETTGIGPDSVCWQIGTIKLFKSRSDGRLVAEFEEIVFPYLPSDLPKRCYNAGAMHAAMECDRDEAAEYAREMMIGEYDPEQFKDHMRDNLKEVLLDRLNDFFSEWSSWEEKIAYNLQFDLAVINRLYDEYSLEIYTSDHPENIEDKKYCAYKTFKRDHPEVRPAKLPHACAHYGIEMDAANAHTALYDATCLMKLWVNMGYV